MEAVHADEYQLSILMETGRRHVDMCLTVYIYNPTHTFKIDTHTMYTQTSHRNTQNQTHLHTNHSKSSRSSHPDVVSRFTEKCFLSTQLHTDVVQSSLMNILLQLYVTITQGPGAAAEERFSIVH